MSNSAYFRISVTSKCNLSCWFCHREGNHSNQMAYLTPEEIQFACKVALKAGFYKFKITGGEPTERDDLVDIISLLSELSLPDLSIITNGTNLAMQSQKLWDAGLRRINVTVNTLNPIRFEQFKPRDGISVQSILKGIEMAKQVGFTSMKINFVFFDEESEKDLAELIKFVKKHDLILVLLPVIDRKNLYSLDYMYSLIGSFGILSEEIITDQEGLRKRKIRLKEGGQVLLRIDELASKKPYIFCEACSNVKQCREGIFPIRLSSNGQLIPCMADEKHRIDVSDIIRRRDEKAMFTALREITLWQKK